MDIYYNLAWIFLSFLIGIFAYKKGFSITWSLTMFLASLMFSPICGLVLVWILEDDFKSNRK